MNKNYKNINFRPIIILKIILGGNKMIDRLSSSNYTSATRISMAEEIKTDNVTEKAFTDSNIKENNEFNNVDKKQIEEVVKGMNKFLEPTHTSLKFQFHEKLNEYYVSIVDDQTREVVREIPPKKLLDMYAAMTEFLGLIVDKKI